MSVQADEAPDDGEEPRRHGESLRAAADEMTVELTSEDVAGRALVARKYVARLLCGCEVAGETRATKVRMGSHGAWCERHERFELFEDLVSTAPLTDSRGKP